MSEPPIEPPPLGELATALAAFQAEMPTVAKAHTAKIKDGFSYTYAGLADVTEAAMPLLAKHGLSFDLFCGAGGCSVGYARAGFDVVGVDINPQPHYPFEFHQADALTFALEGFDAHHASPPCQDHMRTPNPNKHGTGWMLAATRERLSGTGKPWVIENVPGAPLRPDYKLCGCHFDLDLRRERWFETSWRAFELSPPCHHPYPVPSVVGHGTPSWVRQKLGYKPTIAHYRAAMGIDWMNRDELSQAIPPAYTA